MKPEVKEAWIKALRSGKYKQGQRRLRTNDGKFCCLGVLCDISGLAEWGTGKGPGAYQEPGDYLGEGAVLPVAVQEWAGLEDGNPTIQIPDGDYSLATLNDGEHTVRTASGRKKKFGFGSIASIIEKQL